MTTKPEPPRDYQTIRENAAAHSDGGFLRNYRSSIWKLPFERRFSVVVFFSVALLGGALFSNRLFDLTTAVMSFPAKLNKDGDKSDGYNHNVHNNTERHDESPFDCALFNLNKTCTTNWKPKKDRNRPAAATCPEYFRWIHEDLRPWAETGITREMLDAGRPRANFRLAIVNGKAYVEKYNNAFQTRDIFTQWGVLQLLRRYPGKVPDLELMFNCDDKPIVSMDNFRASKAPAPPAMFHYCGDDATYDIAFPDWSFWGWPEIKIKSWVPLMEDIKEGNAKKKWSEREPFAFWKGNPWVSPTRRDLLKCDASWFNDWNARLYVQDWDKASKRGYNNSNLADQCDHRFKIYIEGRAWSVSQKYILACDSVTLSVKSRYYDFFSRGLTPLVDYWPIREDDKCRSIKFAVDWGNNHTEKAQAIGRAGSSFIQEQLKVDFVYDFMFHLLSEYSKLLKFKPAVPPNAVELCSEAMVCPAEGLIKTYMIESAVSRPADSSPCTMPPPYDPSSLSSVLRERENLTKQVEMWEREFWHQPSKAEIRARNSASLLFLLLLMFLQVI